MLINIAETPQIGASSFKFFSLLMEIMQVIFVSKNRHKLEEMQKILCRHGITLKQIKAEVPEKADGNIEEVAVDKAKKAYAKIKKPLIIEDTGVFFDDYGNFPGVQAKRAFLLLGFEGLLKMVRSSKTKKAHFTTVICYIWGKGKYKTFSGKLKGKLLTKLVNEKADVLPYEKFFMPNGKKKTLSQISREEKNKFSHRAQATEKFGKWFAKEKK